MMLRKQLSHICVVKTILTVVLALTILSCSKKQKPIVKAKIECSSFKLGTYKYADTSKAGFIITRNKGVQIEHNKENNDRFVGAITWVEDCKYLLTYIEVSDPKISSLVGASYTVEIIDMTENSYSYRSYNNDQTSTGKLIRIQE